MSWLLAGPETAFLSACTTTRSAAALTDESIHLTSGFQLAGDLSAVALHRTSQRLRRSFPDRPSSWAAYIHARA